MARDWENAPIPDGVDRKKLLSSERGVELLKLNPQQSEHIIVAKVMSAIPDYWGKEFEQWIYQK